MSREFIATKGGGDKLRGARVSVIGAIALAVPAAAQTSLDHARLDSEVMTIALMTRADRSGEPTGAKAECARSNRAEAASRRLVDLQGEANGRQAGDVARVRPT